MLTAGLALKWFRDSFCAEESARAKSEGRDAYDILSDMAASVPPGSEGLIFLPYLNGERTPHADSSARGMFCGLTLRHTKAHLMRAVMEGVAFGLRDSLELAHALGVELSEIILVGGGSKGTLWRQIQADIFGRPVSRLQVSDAAPFGAALLAGIGAEIYQDCKEAVKAAVRTADELAPIPKNVDLYNEYYALYTGVYKNNRETFHRLTGLV
jgi:xylulokinase